MVLLSSCKKFLDKKSDSTLAVPSNLQDLQALLDFSTNMNIRQTPSFGEASCDDYFLTDDKFNALPVEHQGIYTWNRGEYRIQNDWSKAYLAVYHANFCIDQLSEIKVTASNEQSWKNVKGSALFFRSYNYLNLLWVYAKAWDDNTSDNDLGIVLRTSSDFNLPSARSSVKKCYDAVIQDARTAASFLPDYPLHVMRPSKAAAYGLLARTFLSMRKYDSAYKYADLCLQLKNELIDFNGDLDINGTITANVPFKKYNKETIFYTEMNTNFFIQTPTNAKIDTLLYALYNSNDLRKTAYFRPNSGYYQFKGSYTGNSNQFFSGIAVDEILLIRSEANARAGRLTEAMEDLNTLMKKRWKNSVPFPAIIATGQQDAISKILAERRKEICMRGIRWSDIKRLNKENANIILTRKIAGKLFTLQPNANYYALPLPVDIIQLTGIPQNE